MGWRAPGAAVVAAVAAIAAVPLIWGGASGVPAEPAAASAAPGREPPPGGFEVRGLELNRDYFFFGGRLRPTLGFRTVSEVPVRLRVEVMKEGEVIAWIPKRARPGATKRAVWDGRASSGSAAPDGRYRMRVRARGAKRGRGRAALTLFGHHFPVPGSHSYREGLGDFGAPRSGGRVHEGKDVWAPCGTPIVAARGGRVADVGYDPELYGHYVVIDGLATSADLFYVHLLEPASVEEGERVFTGAPIGQVGASGNAASVGCMLHLEVWPDGFRAGDPVDPEPMLRSWDGWS